MLKKILRTLAYLGLIVFFFGVVISCEKDFTDIDTQIVTNNSFTVGDTVLEINMISRDVNRVRGDGLALGGSLAQYLLGVYNNPNHEKIEASIITQLFNSNLNLLKIANNYQSDTTVVTTIDSAFIRIPYQSTLTAGTTSDFTLDSIIGNQNAEFTLNVYRLSSFLNTLNPADPTKQNAFYSNETYGLFPERLNAIPDMPFKPNKLDTAAIVTRRLDNGNVYEKETIEYTSKSPFIVIPLKKDLIKQILLDQYQGSNFSSIEVFNNYLRGLKIEAKGNDGALMSLNLSSVSLIPFLGVYYTNTLYKGGQVIDTIKNTDNFQLAGIRTNQYTMTPGNAPASHNTQLQGTAGKTLQIDLFGPDNNNNNIPDAIDQLRAKNVVINDATLTLYVDKTIVDHDTIATPFRLYAYKDSITSTGASIDKQILDAFTEGIDRVGGWLTLDSDKRPDYYTIKITDYVSELVSGNRKDFSTLGVKVFNSTTDLPSSTNDTIIDPYSWNPKAVMLLNQSAMNGIRRSRLKISFSKKK